MSKIELNDELLIAKGGERACYLHPEDATKVIKVLYSSTPTHNNQNQLEYIYMNYLKKRNANLTYVTDCYGYVQTSLGQGLVFDRALDYNGEPSKSFRYMVAYKKLDLSQQKALIMQLKAYLEKELILFVDTSLTNLYCQEIKKGEYRLLIVDGLGSKRMGFKFWLYRNFKSYTKYKIKRQWAKFMRMYEKDVKRAQLGERPFTRL